MPPRSPRLAPRAREEAPRGHSGLSACQGGQCPRHPSVAVPVRPHSRWARDLVLDFGGRDCLCANDTRLSRAPSRKDSSICREECPARKAISNLSPQFAIGQTCHLRIPPVTGKELCGRIGRKARRPRGYRSCLWGGLGAQDGRRSDADGRLRGGLAPPGVTMGPTTVWRPAAAAAAVAAAAAAAPAPAAAAAAAPAASSPPG